jgi:predicted Zn-dependent peptidase
MLDRKNPPEYKHIDSIILPKTEEIILDNGVKLYFVHTTNEEISEIQFVLKAGIWQQKHLLVANSTIKMMQEGTTEHTSAQISETFDYYGAFFSSIVGMDFTGFKLLCLNKYLPQLISLVDEIISKPIFPTEEFEIFRLKEKQNLILNLEEERIIATNELEQSIFGKDYPYGMYASPEDYDKLKIEWLKEFYEQNVSKENFFIVAAGKDKSKIIEQLNNTFKYLKNNNPKTEKNNYKIISGEKFKYIERENALQAAVYTGWKTFEHTHQDYIDMMILNTLIGGYFGSRLMQNIRQNKGYTYSIYSMLKSYRYSGIFQISSEVNKDSKYEVLDEIKKEIEKISTEDIGTDELQNLKNYLSGSLLMGLSGAFSYSRILPMHIYYDQGLDYYQRYFDRIKTIDAKRLKELSQKYLKPEQMYSVIVG